MTSLNCLQKVVELAAEDQQTIMKIPVKQLLGQRTGFPKGFEVILGFIRGCMGIYQMLDELLLVRRRP